LTSSLRNKGATGDNAGALYKTWSSPPKPVVRNVSDISQVFTPTRRKDIRKQYYDGYTPTYGRSYNNTVVHHSGYGIWDIMLFNSLLDNVGDRQMYYHHQNDSAFQQWRLDANAACAAGDTDICTKLKELDVDVAKYAANKTPINPKYITPGVSPEVYEADVDLSSILKGIKICTGSVGSDYARYLGQMATILKYKFVTVSSSGSMDNLTKLANRECDLTFIQADIPLPAGLVPVYQLDNKEAVTMICGNDTKIVTATDVKPNTTIRVGSDQTGSQHTYSVLQRLLKWPAANTTQTSAQMTTNLAPNECAFTVSSPESTIHKRLDNGKFHLVGFDWDGIKLPRAQYSPVLIKADRYANLTDSSFKHTFSRSGTPAFAVKTTIITTSDWVAQHQQAFDLLNLESTNVTTTVQ
jgi:TRAP-type uncharacterized transport system substrate-binding protein